MHTTAPLLARQTPPDHPFAQAAGSSKRSLHRSRRAQAACCKATIEETVRQKATPICVSSTAIWALSQLPAQAEGTDFSQGSFSKESYYVTLGLFVLSVPGMPTVCAGTGLFVFQGCKQLLGNLQYLLTVEHVYIMTLLSRPLVPDQACAQGQTSTQDF